MEICDEIQMYLSNKRKLIASFIHVLKWNKHSIYRYVKSFPDVGKIIVYLMYDKVNKIELLLLLCEIHDHVKTSRYVCGNYFV